jgi:hypothetical protein
MFVLLIESELVKSILYCYIRDIQAVVAASYDVISPAIRTWTRIVPGMGLSLVKRLPRACCFHPKQLDIKRYHMSLSDNRIRNDVALDPNTYLLVASVTSDMASYLTWKHRQITVSLQTTKSPLRF